MLRALAHPLSFLILLASFVVGVTLHGWVQSLVATRVGDRRPASEGRNVPDPRRHVDPFGAVGALLAGLGWTRPVELLSGTRRRGAQLAVGLSGPLANLLLGLGLLVLFRVLYGPLGGFSSLSLLLEQGTPARGASVALLLVAISQLYIGALSLVPLPPLDGGRLLFALGPRSVGWQKAEHQLIERNIGLVVLLVLLILPIGRGGPLLPQLLDIVLNPLISVVLGA